MIEKVRNSFQSLKNFCEKEGFKGYDPYDGLNSKIFQAIPVVSEKRLFRLAWIQFFKRSPINFRRIAGVAKDYNPKGLGLFLSGYCNMYSIGQHPQDLEIIKFLADKLIELRSNDWSGSCWGYNFDWQARAFFQPKYTPTVVATTFNVYALLDAYDITDDPRYLEVARSAANFVLKDLNRTVVSENSFCFSYSPLDSTQVFNASLLGSKLLSRLYFYTKEKHLIEEAKKAVRYAIDHQKVDGSWAYGTLPFHQWIDNFHTGYNLECIYEYQRFSGDLTFEKNLEKGFEFYVKTFFTEEGISRYYTHAIYPIDIHAPAQLLVTLSRMKKFHQYQFLADRVLNWTIENMQSKKGYFYFQKTKYYTSRVPYIRWAQGWMFYGMSFYLKDKCR